LLLATFLLASPALLPAPANSQTPQPQPQPQPQSQPVQLATHEANIKPPTADPQTIERIRNIILHQGKNPRALANLVQLTRNLDPETAAQLFLDIADEHLRHGDYNEAASFLLQLLNQFEAPQAARIGLLRLMQIYSSSEVNHTQRIGKSPAAKPPAANEQAAFCKYALHVAGSALQKQTALKNDPAVNFQRAATARGGQRGSLSNSFLTRLKHNADGGIWRERAKAEQWLEEDRKSASPVATLVCRRAGQRPHLDGELTESAWLPDQSVQLCYDEEFLYLAVRHKKVASGHYQPDSRPRTHDADLAEHDHVRLRLDLDRDYASYFELAVDHRGWTADRCWLDESWNPQWFVAAGGDAKHWTAEAAIGWQQLTQAAPQAGEAWAVAFERVLPNAVRGKANSLGRVTTGADAPSPAADEFCLLLFE